MLPVPSNWPERTKVDPQYSGLIALCDAMHYKPSELAAHWRCTEGHLSNMRRAGKGPSYIKLPSGKVLYPLSEIVAWETAGRGGPVTLDRIGLALSIMPGLAASDLAKIMEHLRSAFSDGAATGSANQPAGRRSRS